MKLKPFTIIEKKWARGGKGGVSRLRNRFGNKCCLGFLCQTAGARRLTNIFYPDYMPDGAKVVPEFFTKIGIKLSRRIAEINDSNKITDVERKGKLKPLFAKIGWKPVYK